METYWKLGFSHLKFEGTISEENCQKKCHMDEMSIFKQKMLSSNFLNQVKWNCVKFQKLAQKWGFFTQVDVFPCWVLRWKNQFHDLKLLMYVNQTYTWDVGYLTQAKPSSERNELKTGGTQLCTCTVVNIFTNSSILFQKCSNNYFAVSLYYFLEILIFSHPKYGANGWLVTQAQIA